ncbi:hypothetical protein ACJJI3_09300 [Microbulbifer sp. ZKSA004]|uniref:hypothetical protein n=1 Tax=Microbulbifer sp. ZKSA004 TaxID=3243389 RepID=UPI00403A69FE
MKNVLLFLALIISSNVCFAHPSLEQNDTSIGIHGMALFTVGEQVIATHLPLHSGKHSHQVILELETDDQEEVQNLLKRNELVTLLPEEFSLRELREGKLNAFNAKLFTGHFERGGKLALQAVAFRVTSRLMDSPLTRTENGHYQLILLKNYTLLVHEIASTPSFDQILLVSTDHNFSSDIYSSSLKPLSKDSWPKSLTKAGIHYKEELYFESQDFQ